MPNSSSGRTGPDTAVDIVPTLKRAVAAHQNGQLDSAEILYRTVLDSDAHQFDALQMLGILEAQRGKFEDSRDLISRALKANPQSAEAHCNLGRVLRELGRREEALDSFDKALAINPLLIIGLSNRGVVLRELGRAEEALASYDRALTLAPNNIDIMFNRGNVLRDMRRSAEALAVFDAVIGYHAGYVDARIARANILHDMQRYREAIEELDRVLVDQPKNVIALNNRGNVLQALGRDDEALETYNAAVAAVPNYARSYQNRGNLLMSRGLHRNAAADFATALHLDGNCRYALGNFVHCRMQSCDWAGLDEARASLREDVLAGKPAAVPFVLLGADGSPADQLACARTFVADRYPSTAAAPTRREHPHERIRVAYVSADLREHAVSFLAAGLFEQHDRSRFETTAISLSPEQPGPMVDRLEAAFDRFVTVAGKTDAEVVALMRELEIDIAVDLMGHTRNARTGIFAARPAPIQVNCLGHGGTMGADYIDYIVADEFLIPAQSRRYYSEQPVYLPDSAQVNDRSDIDRVPARTKPTREQAGLPDGALVFCAFNESYKITPELFAVWMRLLQAVDGSVLWLLASDSATESLKREAAALGVVAAHRLVFAPTLPHADHLARCALADIFLDTLPCNGGAATSGLLSAGVPVVTCAGDAFVSRVSGSLLRAVGLSELITSSLADYEAAALALAREPDRLAQTKEKLAANRLTSPLFDTKRFARHLEAAYVGMWQRFQRGEKPSSFAVDPIA